RQRGPLVYTALASLTSLPRADVAIGALPAWPSLFGLAPGGVYHAGSVAGPAVGSYRTFSPLLAPMSLHRKKWRCVGKRFVLCGTFPGVAPAGCYPAHANGARTFLSGHLSALAGAAVRPTDSLTQGDLGSPRQVDIRSGAPKR